MSEVPIWFERKFEFSFPPELFPNLLVRLRGMPARLEELLRGCSREILIRKPGGKWSAQEHAGHLLDLEPLWLARVEDYVAGSSQLTVTDLQNRKTDDANHNARPLEEILTELPRRQSKAAEPRRRTGFPSVFAGDSTSPAEDADAAGRPFVFCR